MGALFIGVGVKEGSKKRHARLTFENHTIRAYKNKQELGTDGIRRSPIKRKSSAATIDFMEGLQAVDLGDGKVEVGSMKAQR